MGKAHCTKPGFTLLFKCKSCGELYPEPIIKCPACGGLVLPFYGRARRFRVAHRHSIWGFEGSLPDFPVKVTLGEGFTPLVESWFIGRDKGVYFKDEGRNPTGSTRDRAACIVVSHAASLKYKRVVAASDGNMGVSIAAYAAKAGLKAAVYAPPWIDSEKALLIRAYGAELELRDKSIDAIVKDVSELSEKTKSYNASTTSNPLSIEGLKTISYEVLLDLGRVPRSIYVPLGSGITLLSIYYGFLDLVEAGLAPRIPRLVGVEHCGNPKYAEHLSSVSKCREEAYPGLRYYTPPVFNHVLEVLEKQGEVVVVTSRETLRAAKQLATREGLFTEPSSAVAVAGYLKREEEDSVILLFGHGVKSASAFARPRRRRFTAPYVGITKKLILEVLRSKPGLTGYEVWRELGLNITPQAVYQHLRDLAEMGLIRVVERSGVKRYYASLY